MNNFIRLTQPSGVRPRYIYVDSTKISAFGHVPTGVTGHSLIHLTGNGGKIAVKESPNQIREKILEANKSVPL